MPLDAIREALGYLCCIPTVFGLIGIFFALGAGTRDEENEEYWR